MRAIVRFTAGETRPSDREVLAALHVGSGASISAALRGLLEQGRLLFDSLADPVAVFQGVSREEFAGIYAGDGRNAEASPLEAIASRADRIALFAGTLGPAIDAAVRHRFRDGDAALGYVLDAFASCAANRVADLTARGFLATAGCPGASSALPYSPGYCGWDVSGQRSLFRRLRPEGIGIVLSPSCLMRPLKSVSGAIVVGRGEIHRFKPAYPFCTGCATRDCIGRMRAAGKPGASWTS